MRVGLLIYGDMESVSGGYLYNRKLVSYLRNQGDSVQIISLPPRHYWQHLGDNFDNAFFAQIIAAEIDVLIQDAMVHPSVFLLNYRLRKKINIPIITLVHLLTTFDFHPFYSRPFYRFIERRYFQSVAGMIVNSQTTLSQIKALLPACVPSHCVAVPAGDNFPDVNVNLKQLQQKIFHSQTLKILVVGNVIFRKGLHILIHALHELADENFLVTIAGRLDMEPRYTREVQELVETFQLQKQVVFKGIIQGNELASLYQENHLMVLPSAYESYGIVYVEAQQFGLPVIGTTAGAAKEIITHAENGYLIPPENSHALAELLQTLQNDRALLFTLSQNALASYAQHPRWADSCEIIRYYIIKLSELQQTSCRVF